ncbi:MAG: glycoside hydrolase family 18 [Bacteroidales bacterium]|nr:glycoside hydrolase family 18 [Bacteroidales bacterium]
MKNKIYCGLAAAAAVISMASCSDWTDPERVDVVYDGIAETDAEAYAKYLQNLRDYRANDHKKVYAWYENKGSFTSQADHVSAVPDSIDVLVLKDPTIVTGDALYDMQQKRTQTGMQMACTVDYNSIQSAFNALVETGTDASGWSAYLKEQTEAILSGATAADLDRVIAAYETKDFSMMTSAEAAEAAANEASFFQSIMTWAANVEGRAYDFMGTPATVNDKTILSGAGVIFLSETASATSTAEYNLAIARSSATGVPTDRFAVVAPLPGTDANGNAVGTWGSTYTSWDAAEWSRGASVTALGLTNLANDYYNPTFIYPVSREAIQILNPAAK